MEGAAFRQFDSEAKCLQLIFTLKPHSTESPQALGYTGSCLGDIIIGESSGLGVLPWGKADEVLILMDS